MRSILVLTIVVLFGGVGAYTPKSPIPGQERAPYPAISPDDDVQIYKPVGQDDEADMEPHADLTHVRAGDNNVVIHPYASILAYNSTGTYDGKAYRGDLTVGPSADEAEGTVTGSDGETGATGAAPEPAPAQPAAEEGPCCRICPKRTDCLEGQQCYSHCHRQCGSQCEVPVSGVPVCTIGVDCGMMQPLQGSSGVHDQDMKDGYETMSALPKDEDNTPDAPLEGMDRYPLDAIDGGTGPGGVARTDIGGYEGTGLGELADPDLVDAIHDPCCREESECECKKKKPHHIKVLVHKGGAADDEQTVQEGTAQRFRGI